MRAAVRGVGVEPPPRHHRHSLAVARLTAMDARSTLLFHSESDAPAQVNHKCRRNRWRTCMNKLVRATLSLAAAAVALPVLLSSAVFAAPPTPQIPQIPQNMPGAPETIPATTFCVKG